MNKIIDTEEDLSWIDDSDLAKYFAFVDAMKADGFLPCPDDMAVGEPGREYAFYGPLAYYRPIQKEGKE